MSFICHTHNYTEYNEEWNVFSAFNPSKCTHTWSSGQPTLQRSWGFSALPKGLTSVVDTSCQSRDSNPQPRVLSQTLYPLGHDCHDCGIILSNYMEVSMLDGRINRFCNAYSTNLHINCLSSPYIFLIVYTIKKLYITFVTEAYWEMVYKNMLFQSFYFKMSHLI